MKRFFFILPAVFVVAIALALGVATPSARAQAVSCVTPQERAQCQQAYDSLQQEIAQWQQVLTDTKQKKASLQGDVTALTAAINKAQAEIKQRTIAIANISTEITQKSQLITTLQTRIDKGKASLAKILRNKNEIDTMSLAEVLLSSQNFASLYGDLDQLSSVEGALASTFKIVQTAKTQTEAEKRALDAQQNQQLDAKYEVETTKKLIADNQVQKKQLLSITATNEAAYQKVLVDRQQKAEAIRSALFDLRDTEGIQFGTALSYANAASRATGVRAALILAILSQESDLGKNVGACYVTDLSTGDGVGKNTGTPFQRVMKAPRDTNPFQSITSALGLAWATEPVSCPLGTVYSSSRGYGGAMGPSQFIPSTWQLYAPRLSKILSVIQPNPWKASDAIMATALYRQDLGAAGGTYTAERNAACRYYSGRSCDSRKPTNYTYGDSVVAKAQEYQTNIDFLSSI